MDGIHPSAVGAGLRVLFVDDDELLLAALRRVFSQEGRREVFFLSDPGAVNALVAREHIDVVVADNFMPGTGTSGIELLSRLAADQPHVFRVLVSGVIDDDTTRRAKTEAAVDRVLEKPWTPAEMRGLLASLRS